MDKPVANMVLVPVDPTKEMIGAATRVDFDNEDEVAMTINLWNVMVAAAPALPAIDAGEVVAWLRREELDHIINEMPVTAELFSDAATLLQSLSADNARLREEWDEVADLAGKTVAAANDAVEIAEARLSEAVEVLKPFAEYLNGMPVDLDNKGKPVPDDQGVGWAYLTVGQFRAARQFLDTQGGGNG